MLGPSWPEDGGDLVGRHVGSLGDSELGTRTSVLQLQGTDVCPSRKGSEEGSKLSLDDSGLERP